MTDSKYRISWLKPFRSSCCHLYTKGLSWAEVVAVLVVALWSEWSIPTFQRPHAWSILVQGYGGSSRPKWCLYNLNWNARNEYRQGFKPLTFCAGTIEGILSQHLSSFSLKLITPAWPDAEIKRRLTFSKSCPNVAMVAFSYKVILLKISKIVKCIRILCIKISYKDLLKIWYHWITPTCALCTLIYLWENLICLFKSTSIMLEDPYLLNYGCGCLCEAEKNLSRLVKQLKPSTVKLTEKFYECAIACFVSTTRFGQSVFILKVFGNCLRFYLIFDKTFFEMFLC